MSLTVGLLGWSVLIAFLASLAWVISTFNRLTALRAQAARARSELKRCSDDPTASEDHLAAARRELIESEKVYDRAVGAFPAAVLAAAFGFRRE